MLRFTDTVRGLKVGAEVEFRGIRIGTVTRIDASLDAESGKFLIPVHIDIEPDRWLSSNHLNPGLSIDEQQKQLNKSLEYLVSKGLRGRLQTGSLLTGQLYVEFDLYPESKAAELAYAGRYPELPVIPGQLASITAALNKLLARLDNTPLEQTLANLNQFMTSTSSLAAVLENDIPTISSELKLSLAEARSTLKSANDTLASIKEATDPDSQISNTLHKTLSEVRNAARSIRIMADYLERHPEALLRGKDGRQ
jgi:paraquat-inducible protein B